MSEPKIFRPLDPPPDVFDAQHAQEVLRFWVADGIDHLRLEINAIGSDDGEYHGAEIWGSLIADIARHVVNAFNQDFECEENTEQLFALVNRGYFERLEAKLDENIIGKLGGISSHAH